MTSCSVAKVLTLDSLTKNRFCHKFFLRIFSSRSPILETGNLLKSTGMVVLHYETMSKLYFSLENLASIFWRVVISKVYANNEFQKTAMFFIVLCNCCVDTLRVVP